MRSSLGLTISPALPSHSHPHLFIRPVPLQHAMQAFTRFYFTLVLAAEVLAAPIPISSGVNASSIQTSATPSIGPLPVTATSLPGKSQRFSACISSS
jgi:hypothetical protein